MSYVLYTDGSANVADKSGAWAYAIIDTETDTVVREACEFVHPTTNNRMELQGVLEGLKQFRPDTPLEVVSDSAYVVNCFNQGWWKKWQRNNWYATSGPVKNVELWQAILAILKVRTVPVVWTHVRGHQGNKWNEYVDRMCDKARREGVKSLVE